MQVFTSSEFKDYLSELLSDCEEFEKYLTNTTILDEQQRAEIILRLRKNLKERLSDQIHILTTSENSDNYSKGVEEELQSIDFDEFERGSNPLLLFRRNRKKSP